MVRSIFNSLTKTKVVNFGYILTFKRKLTQNLEDKNGGYFYYHFSDQVLFLLMLQ